MSSSGADVRIVVPDLISPSYFPALAAVELGCLERMGVRAELSLLFPVTDAVEALRAGEVDVVAGAAHTLFHGSGDELDVCLLGALSHRTYWFLVLAPGLGMESWDDLSSAEGLRIAAAPGPDAALRHALDLAELGPDAVELVPVPSIPELGPSFGVQAARALERGEVDGFWANGMGAELAVREGIGRVVVDARRSLQPPGLSRYTFAALMGRRADEQDERVLATVAALVEAHEMLRGDPHGAASQVAGALFPPLEASLAGGLVERDAPFYEVAIEPSEVSDLSSFARAMGFTTVEGSFDDVVSRAARPLWRGGDRQVPGGGPGSGSIGRAAVSRSSS